MRKGVVINMKKRNWRGMLAAALLLALCLTMPAAALDRYDYVLDTDGATRIPTPLTYRCTRVIAPLSGEFGTLNQPKAFYIASDAIFVADSGNNRVVKLSLQGEILGEFTEADGTAFNAPAGVFVDDDGDLYVSDTGNHRLVHLAGDGRYVETFVKPESELLDDNLIFDISTVRITDGGMIYVLKGQNFMMIDPDNQFRGYLGANKVTLSFQYIMLNLFASEQQKQYLNKPKPAVYNSFTLSDKGMVYATCEGEVNQLQLINASGKNIFPSKFYGERTISDAGLPALPRFIDIAVNDGSYVAAIDQKNARIYLYSSAGELLTVFGGAGTTKGFFDVPAALAVDGEDSIYVLDSARGEIQVFTPTTFFKDVLEANRLFIAGDYDKAYDAWNQVYQVDASYPLANSSMARTLLKNNRLENAMSMQKTADDKAGYSESFSEWRHLMFREHFGPVVLAAAVIAAALILAFIWLKKWADRMLAAYYDGKSGPTRKE